MKTPRDLSKTSFGKFDLDSSLVPAEEARWIDSLIASNQNADSDQVSLFLMLPFYYVDPQGEKISAFYEIVGIVYIQDRLSLALPILAKSKIFIFPTTCSKQTLCRDRRRLGDTYSLAQCHLSKISC
jgi:hypothetical protein